MAAESFIVHVTRAGERWDLLAWRYYGDASAYRPIIVANPDTAIEPVFEAAVVILVPVLERSASDDADLPPWRRAEP